MSGNALKLGGFTLPNPIVMVENMLADGVLISNDNHASDNFGSLKFNGGSLKNNWAFLNPNSTGFMGKAADNDHDVAGAAGGGAAAQTMTATTTTAGGPVQQYVKMPAQKTGVGGQRGVVQQNPMQSPTQSPIQSPIQGPPMKVQPVPVQQVEQIKRGLQNPLAVPVGVIDGLVDFITHCVGAHVDFLWKDPMSILKDPVKAVKLNQLEINPLGHIFKSIEQANQRDNPVQQLMQIPMGLETLPMIKNTAAGKAAAADLAKYDDHSHAPGQEHH